MIDMKFTQIISWFIKGGERFEETLLVFHHNTRNRYLRDLKKVINCLNNYLITIIE
jgi:hypothetical protein